MVAIAFRKLWPFCSSKSCVELGFREPDAKIIGHSGQASFVDKAKYATQEPAFFENQGGRVKWAGVKNRVQVATNHIKDVHDWADRMKGCNQTIGRLVVSYFISSDGHQWDRGFFLPVPVDAVSSCRVTKKTKGASNQARSWNPGNGSIERYLADAPSRERGSSTASIDQEPEGSGLPFSRKQQLNTHALSSWPWLKRGLALSFYSSNRSSVVNSGAGSMVHPIDH